MHDHTPSQSSPGRESLARRHSIQWRLPLFISGFLAIVLATFVWAAFHEVDQAFLRAAGERAQVAADQIADLLGAVRVRAAEMRRLAADPAIRRLLVERSADAREPALAKLRLIATSGQQLSELWTSSGERLLSIAVPEGLDGAFPRDLPVEGTGLRLDITPQKVVVFTMAEPVTAAGEASAQPATLGYVVMRRPVASNSNSDLLNRLVGARIELGGSGGGNWTNLTGLVPAPPIDLTKMGFHEYRDPASGSRIGALTRLSGTPWLIWVSVPRGPVTAQAYAFVRDMSLIALLFFAVAVIVSAAVTSRWIRPLSALTSASEAIAAGDYQRHVAQDRSDEIGRLGAAFNSMVTQVREAHSSLVERAEHATLAADVATALAASDPVGVVLTRCMSAIVQHLNAGEATIWTVSGAGSEPETFELQASASGRDLRPRPVGARASGRRPEVERIAASGEPYVSNDAAADPQFQGHPLVHDDLLVSFAGYPVKLHDHVVGVLAVFGQAPWPEGALDALAGVARAVALGIQRRQLETSRGQLADILDAGSDFVTIGRPDMEPTYLNRAVRRALGIGDRERVHSMLPFRPKGFREYIETVILPAAVRDGSWSGETEYISKDGKVIPVSQVSVVHKNARGGVEFVSTISRDMTDRQSLELQLRQAQKMEAVGQLAGGIAHDFNNLLTAIQGYAELLSDSLGRDDVRQADALEIQRAAERASGLTRQLLAFSRKQILAPRVLRVRDVINAVVPMLRRLLGEAIELDTVITDAGLVKADSGQLEQVIVNLAVNASDAMPDGGRLTIEASDVWLDDEYARTHAGVRRGPYVALSVTDTGHGMDAATQQRVFEPFFTTKPMGQGTGLGLAMVHGIVAQSGGHLWVYSELDHGTTFKIYLPRTDETEERAAVAPGQHLDLRGTETILLVEDEGVVREFALRVLRQAGYNVHTVSKPDEAMALAQTLPAPIQLIFSDVVLPQMNGRVLSGRLREFHPEASVLYMSGYTDDAIVSHGVLDAQMWFLQKPFSADALLRKVREVLDSRIDGSGPW